MLKKYVILTTQRTGSSWLSDVLYGHVNVSAYMELFRITPEEDYPVYGNRDTMLFEKWSKKKKYLDIFFRKKPMYNRYIDEIKMRASEQENIRIFGFKLMYAQERVNKGLWSCLNQSFDKFIHLKRENLLDRAISKIYMEETGIAHSHQIATSSELTATRTLNRKEVLRHVRRDFLIQKQYDKKIADLPQDKVKILIYEDMVEKLDAVLSDLYEFLEVPFQKPISNFKKVSSPSPRGYIRNYDDLMAEACDKGLLIKPRGR